MKGERKNIRLSKWDYSSEGVYFITVCCCNRSLYLDSINNKNKVILSGIGQIAAQFWLEIPSHFPHIKIDKFVIMPNHVHGILFLDYSLTGKYERVAKNIKYRSINKFSNPVKNSISIIINQYKSSVKRWCNQNGYEYFQWQPRFYDQILRNEKSIDAIRQYINTNPRNWIDDDLYNS